METVERTAAITGIINTLDAEWILDARLGHSSWRHSKNTSGKQHQNDDTHRLLLRPCAEKLRPAMFSVYAKRKPLAIAELNVSGRFSLVSVDSEFIRALGSVFVKIGKYPLVRQIEFTGMLPVMMRHTPSKLMSDDRR